MEIDMLNIEYGSKEYFDSLDLRNEVFRKPWGLDIKDDDLEIDKKMDMYGAFVGGQLIGTVFLLHKDEKTVQIKTLAIYEKFRGIGLGHYLMKFIEEVAKEKGYKKAYLTGREYAENFYKGLGYRPMGKPFLYKTIAHMEMEKDL